MSEQGEEKPKNPTSSHYDNHFHDAPYADGPRMRLGQEASNSQLGGSSSSSARGGSFSILGNDPATRKLIGFSLAVFFFLLLFVCGWLFLGRNTKGIPVIGPPDFAAKERPVDPGGMQIMSDDTASGDVTGKGEVHLAPPPEQPDARALARREEPSFNQGEGEAQRDEKIPSQVSSGKNISSTSDTSPDPKINNDTHSNLPQEPETIKPQPPVARPRKEKEVKSVQKSPTPPTVTRKKVTTPSTSSEKKEGRYQVQLGALSNKAQAEHAWVGFRSKASDIVAGYTPRYQAISRDGKNFIRLRVGGFPDAKAARLFCARLHAKSLVCSPVAF